MFTRHLATAAITSLTLIALASPAAAQSLDQTADPTVYGSTPDRLWAAVAALLALAGVIVGGWFLARAKRRTGGSNRKLPMIALALGLVAAVNGALVVITSDGGPGTGNGIVGGYIAIVLGLAAALLNRLALTRARSGEPGQPDRVGN